MKAISNFGEKLKIITLYEVVYLFGVGLNATGLFTMLKYLIIKSEPIVSEAADKSWFYEGLLLIALGSLLTFLVRKRNKMEIRIKL